MKKRYLCMAAIIFLMNTLTGCALKNENMEAIYKEFLDNGDVGSLNGHGYWNRDNTKIFVL